MDMIYWTIIVLGVFVAVWMLFVVPSERRHHERKLEIIRKRLADRQASEDEEDVGSSGDANNDKEEA